MHSRFLLWASALPVISYAYPSVNQYWSYLSRPELNPPKWEFDILDESKIAPGYILMAPYSALPDSNLAAGSTVNLADLTPAQQVALFGEFLENDIQNGPCIYDEKGNLVWSGFGSAGGQYSHDLKITDYHGTPHLSFFQGTDGTEGDRGYGVIMDNTYHVVETVNSGLGRAPNDIHEFSVIGGGSTALTTIFQPQEYDLSPYGLHQPYGWVIEGIFQEIDIATGRVDFEWRSLDHTDLSDSYNTYGSAGTANGSTPQTVYDYFHMNSIDKDKDGNYLISSRYLCALFKINGTSGEIIWQLGGKKNQFKFEGFENGTFPFSFQHHARIRDQNSTTTIISLFDNGSDGFISTQNHSSGLIMAIDTLAMTCTLLREYIQPQNALSASQGSIQPLSNGNIFMGWGSKPYISEFLENGTCIMNAAFGATNLNISMNYRAFKVDWHGFPDSTPALWSWTTSKAQPTTFYTSWNGHTEIATWAFYGGQGTSQEDCNTFLGHANKIGFETNFTAARFYSCGYSEALDINGKSLGLSPLRFTYVPNSNSTTSVPY